MPSNWQYCMATSNGTRDFPCTPTGACHPAYCPHRRSRHWPCSAAQRQHQPRPSGMPAHTPICTAPHTHWDRVRLLPAVVIERTTTGNSRGRAECLSVNGSRLEPKWLRRRCLRATPSKTQGFGQRKAQKHHKINGPLYTEMRRKRGHA